MFGSNFAQQFGLSGPPWDNLDAYAGMFGPNAPVTPLPGELGGQQPVAGPGDKPPVEGTVGVQPQPAAPQAPPVVSGNFTPETFESTTYQPGQGEESGGGPPRALSPGPLTAGANSEFAKSR